VNLSPRQVALKTGKTRYFTGIACPRGHRSERMVSTRACCECAMEKKHAWIAANPEKVNAQKRAWRNANIEKARALNLANQKLHRDSANARNRKWLAANREQSNAASRSWAVRNPDKVAARMAKRRSSRLHQTPKWADLQAIAIIYRAASVIRTTGFNVHVDHVFPLQGKSVRGLHVHNNLQIMRANANQSKSNHI